MRVDGYEYWSEHVTFVVKSWRLRAASLSSFTDWQLCISLDPPFFVAAGKFSDCCNTALRTMQEYANYEHIEDPKLSADQNKTL